MKVRIIKDFKLKQQWIRKGEVLKVRVLRNFAFGPPPQVQVIEGEYSGEFISREYFVEIPEEKTFTEIEYNDLENHYLNLLSKERNKVTTQKEELESLQREKKRLENEVDEARQVEKAVLPLEVYEVFDRVNKAWNSLLGKEGRSLLFLTIVGLRVEGDSLVLQKFAFDNPTTYMQAVSNGYRLADEDVDKAEIRKWYKGALIRESDKTDPDGFAKEAIEEVVHYLGANEILADLSPFCRNQLSKKKAN